MLSKDKIEDFYKYLDLKRKIIGVKFIHSEEEYNNIPTKELDIMASYCYMVKLASENNSFKACNKNFKCNSSAMALGIRSTSERVTSGQQYFSYKTYDSISRAKAVQKEVTYIEHKIYGVLMMPLEKFDICPDVFIIISNNYQAMRIVQSYTYHNGIANNIKLCGNQGVCSELTARPYENNDMNLSMLCSNTRFSCQWDDSEMGIGMPFNMFDSIYDGLIHTINPMELDKKKEKIVEKMNSINNKLDIQIGKNYFNSSVGYIELNK
ncbi:DUF169 domain-containing protein [Hathewaya histolytica]|uniref:DUF169 domain-containing protein n=1 Tax=Hathewaya histolytica TaxID=1498 RepID=UPI003B683FB2